MKRGFTIVELITVVSVISILAGITVMSYSAYSRRADDSAAKGMASILQSSANRYYTANNEYPSATELGAVASASPPSSYTLASQKLDVPATSFSNDKRVFVPCYAGANCSMTYLNKKYVYYFSKQNQTDTASLRQLTVPADNSTAECRYEIPTADVGATTYLLAFWSWDTMSWKVAKSPRGTVTISKRPNNGTFSASDSTACPFTTL